MQCVCMYRDTQKDHTPYILLLNIMGILFSFGFIYGIWKFPGQGLNSSHIATYATAATIPDF